ncbi:MAG: hypothetical protein JWM27_3455 [Gemmatimonadetes bacterium]|nr:hypothetical protein [Gemmatimonadota bacterium]
MNLVRRTLRLALLAAPVALAPARSALAQIVVTSANVEEREARPRETWSGIIRLRNTTGAPQEARVYLADYAFQADGTARYPDPGTAPRSSARWTTVSPGHLTVPANGEATVAYTVAVPAQPALAGTYWSMVMIQAVSPGDPASAAARNARVQVGVRPTIRYGVQLATTLAGTGAAKAAFASPRAEPAAGGHRSLSVDVLNDGTLAYRPKVRLELFDAAGNPVGRWEAVRGLLYPGTSLRQAFDLGALPAGAYQALVVADAGGDSVFGARYRLSL